MRSRARLPSRGLPSSAQSRTCESRRSIAAVEHRGDLGVDPFELAVAIGQMAMKAADLDRHAFMSDQVRYRSAGARDHHSLARCDSLEQARQVGFRLVDVDL